MHRSFQWYLTQIPFCLNVLEAEMAKNRIAELKEQEYNMEYQQLMFTHQ